MNSPQLRFKNFYTDWKKIKLGDYAIIRGRLGWKGLKQEEYVEDGPYLIAGKHIDNGIINWALCDKIPFYRYEESLEIALENEDIIFSKDGSLGNPAIIKGLNEKATINSTMMLVRITDKNHLHAEYVYQILNSNVFKKLIYMKVSGSSIPHLFQADMKEFEFCIPSSTIEQRKIASFLSEFDNKIRLQQERVNLLKQLKKGYLQKIFSQELRFKDRHEKNYPKWEIFELSHFAHKIVRKNKDLAITNVISNSARNGLISQKEYFDKEIANQENINGYFVISKGDFVYNPRISSDAPYGPINIYKDSEPGIVSPLYMCFNIKNINKDFMFYYFKSTSWHKYIYMNGDSGARHDRVSIKDSTFLEMPISVPCEEEQNQIASFFLKLESKLNSEQKKLVLLKEQKQAFMQQMFI